MKYSPSFERDFNWYLSVRKEFVFSGSIPKFYNEVTFDKNGISGKEAFHKLDSTGKLYPTRHPNILRSLIKTKASVNFQIKEWAQGRADCTLPLIEFSLKTIWKRYGLSEIKTLIKVHTKKIVKELRDKDIEHQLKLPDWVISAVENQRLKYF